MLHENPGGKVVHVRDIFHGKRFRLEERQIGFGDFARRNRDAATNENGRERHQKRSAIHWNSFSETAAVGPTGDGGHLITDKYLRVSTTVFYTTV